MFWVGFFICWILIALLIVAVDQFGWFDENWWFYTIAAPITIALFPFVCLVKFVKSKWMKFKSKRRK